MEKNSIIYLLVSFAIGFGIAYYFFKGDTDTSPFLCGDKNITLQYCVDTSTSNAFPKRLNDDVLQEYYTKACQDGDSIAFTLRKEIILDMAAYMQFDPNCAAIRFYPGMVGQNKKVIAKPMDTNGNEKRGIGRAIDADMNGLDGPCPKWCGSGTRVINLPTPPPPSGG